MKNKIIEGMLRGMAMSMGGKRTKVLLGTLVALAAFGAGYCTRLMTTPRLLIGCMTFSVPEHKDQPPRNSVQL